MMRQAVLLPAAFLILITTTACPKPHQPCHPCSYYNLPPIPAAAEAPDVCSEIVPARGETPIYDNLVFQGGGVKGIGYAGALPVFGDERLSHVGRVAGTSAGAITALALSVGYTTEEVCDLSLAIEFEKFEDGEFLGDVERLFKDYGWYKGDYAQCLLECVVENKTGHKNTTFADLHAKRQHNPAVKDLFVFGTDVNSHESVEFSYRQVDKRDLPIAHAARISMSIPFFFAAERLEDNVFVDGGVLRNYPLDVFDKEEPNAATLGFHLGAEPPKSSIHNLLQFSDELVVTVLNDQVDRTCRTATDVERSIFINTLGIKATDFDISRADQLKLIEQGEQSTRIYLDATEPHPKTCPVFVQELLPSTKH